MKKTIYFLPLLLLFICSGVFAESTSVLIIKSSDNGFFNKTIDQLVKKAGEQIDFQIQTLDVIKADDLQLSRFSAIITLGITADKYPFKQNLNIPVIHSYITRYQYLKHQEYPNHHSVLLDQSLQRYLTFIKYLLAPKSIAIISHHNQTEKRSMELNASSLQLEIDHRIFKSGDNILNLVRDSLKFSDALLSLPNPDIYNRKTLKAILLTSYRQNKPVISYSPAHVKSGALAAIFSSPENIGNQLADLLNIIISNKSFKPESFYYASGFDVKINYRVAKSLGLTLGTKEQIINQLKQGQGQ